MQGREHRFRECKRWGKEIRRLWEEAGNTSGKREPERQEGRGQEGHGHAFGKQERTRPSNTAIKELVGNEADAEAALSFLKHTGVGKANAGVLDGDRM